MATSTLETNGGNLNSCAYCGSTLHVAGGTDPSDPSPGFVEYYECENGHRGTYEHAPSGDSFTGACRQ